MQRTAMKGKQIRNKVLVYLLSLLWHGKTDTAITYLMGLDKDDIKNQSEIERLIGYFECNRSYIPCYARRCETWTESMKSIEVRKRMILWSQADKNTMA